MTTGTNSTTTPTMPNGLVLVHMNPRKYKVVPINESDLVMHFGKLQEGNRCMPDAKDMLLKLTNKELSIFFKMDTAKDSSTHEVDFSRQDCPGVSASHYKQIVAALVAKDMIIRMRNNHYLMNPNVFLPYDKLNYGPVLAKWNSLGGKLPTV